MRVMDSDPEKNQMKPSVSMLVRSQIPKWLLTTYCFPEDILMFRFS